MDFESLLSCEVKCSAYMIQVLDFLRNYFWIYNGHMTKVLSDSSSPLYNIPADWHAPLLRLSFDELKQVPFGFVNSDWPDTLKQFVTSALKYGCLRFMPVSLDKKALGRSLPVSLLNGMTPKKQEEVIGVARLVASVCYQSGSPFVLDIGSGMGYLGQVLHYCYGLTVLGVDACFSHGAQQRIEKHSSANICSQNVFYVPFILESTYDSLSELQKLLENAEEPLSCPCQSESLHVTETRRSWVIVALHGCGDLTNSILQFYKKCPLVTALVCLSCCYHKMTPGSFPLSSCLQKCVTTRGKEEVQDNDFLGPYGLRLASQESRARWADATPDQHLKRIDHTLYRASIEYALNNRRMQWKRPQRRLGKEAYSDYETYCQAALSEYDDSIKEEARKAYAIFQSQDRFLGQLALLQVLVQPVLESIILLDRACFLKFDQAEEHLVWLEAVAEELLSPRNIALTAVKKEVLSRSS